MKLRLHRKWLKQGYSIGVLYIDGVRVCETLEDEDRNLREYDPLDVIKKKKVKGATAIPIGTYQVVWSYSPKFKKMLPLLKDVPAYEGIRIHAGNTNKDTEGCILCGRNTAVGKVTNSRHWTEKVCKAIENAYKKKEQITITIHW